MRRKLHTKRGRRRYARRMETVEPVFGQIQQGRGFGQFLLRGSEKVNGEWSLTCTGHHLLKLFRFGRLAPGRAWGHRLTECVGCPRHRMGTTSHAQSSPERASATAGIINADR